VNKIVGKKGTYLSTKRFNSQEELREEMAIPENWGIRNRVAIVKPDKDTWESISKTEGQKDDVTGKWYRGGGEQVFILNLPKSSIVRTERAFK
jgi:hypothetical protein